MKLCRCASSGVLKARVAIAAERGDERQPVPWATRTPLEVNGKPPGQQEARREARQQTDHRPAAHGAADSVKLVAKPPSAGADTDGRRG